MIRSTTSSRSNSTSSALARNASLAVSHSRIDALLDNVLIRYGHLGAMQIAQLKQWLLDFVKKGDLVRVAKALMELIKAHPWKFFGSLTFIIVGIVLIANPLAMVGFGALGPIAGTSLSG
jgi:hypothetical protein